MQNGGNCARAVLLHPSSVSLLTRIQEDALLDGQTIRPEEMAPYAFCRVDEGVLMQTNTRFVMHRLSKPWQLHGGEDCLLLSDPHFELIPDADLSNAKAVLIDHSVNGVYVNSHRVDRKATVSPGDWIFAGGLSFFYFDHLLLLPASCALADDLQTGFVRAASCRRPDAGRCTLIEAGECMQVEIEAPVNDEQESLSAGGSPAGMMVISAMASVLSGFLMNPNDLKTVLSSACGSGISALAFVLWYARQNQKSRKQNGRVREQTMEAYLGYLEEQASSLDAKRLEQSRAFFHQEQAVSTLDDGLRMALHTDDWKMPAGLEFVPFASLELPALGWQLKNERARKALDSLAALNLRTPVWSLFSKGSELVLHHPGPSVLKDLFLVWVWMVWTDRRRFAFCGCSLSGPELSHPACRLDEVSLCFKDRQALRAFVFLHPQIEWTVLSAEPLSLDELPAGSSLIRIEEEEKKTASSTFVPENRPETMERKAMLQLQLDVTARKKKLRQSVFLPAVQAPCAKSRPSCLEAGLRRGQPVMMQVDLAPGVCWDLVKEGPHALIAGSTGSGKSEGLCGVLFQLAWQNGPDQVQFILIDFKGGSFGAPLKDLPHTAGYMTNLQSGSILRMEQALKRELDDRQNRISAWLADHPGAEPSIEGCPQLGMSHILICVDEFGQLKDRAPEFMKSLQETARIGRSLGVHLILSTQKPAGLVDEQIWANSKSRLCFGVLDPADSREVLGHEGAAALKEPGEFLLQVSGRPEKKGRAWYLKGCADGRSEIDVLDPVQGWTRIERLCLQDQMRKDILAAEESRRWILAPDPLDLAKDFSSVVIDRIDHYETMTARYASIALLGSRRRLDQTLSLLLAGENRRIASTFEHPCADQIIDPASLCETGWMEEENVILLDDPSLLLPALLERLFTSPRVTLILAAETISFSLENLMGRFEARLFLDLDSREQKSAFFGGRLIAEQTWPAIGAWIGGKEERLVIGQAKPQQSRKPHPPFLPECRLILKKEQILRQEGALFLGLLMEGRRPLFYRHEAVSFVYSTAKGKRMAEQLFERLRRADLMIIRASVPGPGRIAFTDLCDLDEMSACDRLREQIRQGTFIFFGKGLESIACLIGLSLPFERSADALYFMQDTLLDFCPAGLEDA